MSRMRNATDDRCIAERRRNARKRAKLRRRARLANPAPVQFAADVMDTTACMIRLSVWSRLWRWLKSLFQRGR